MSAVWMHLRATVRSGFFATVGLILLVGVTGGVVLSAAAGARRTETAFPRMLEATRGADALISPERTGTGGFFAAVEQLPEVEAAGPAAACLAFARPNETDQRNFFPGVAAMDHRMLHQIERPKLFAGRAPHPERAGEALANKRLADELDLRVGQRVRFAAVPSDFETPFADVPRVSFTIVGIGVFPGEVVPSTQLDAFPTLFVTPAYLRMHPEQPGCEGLAIKLRSGGNIERLRLEASEIAATRSEVGGEIFFQNQRLRNAKVARAIRPQAVALWLFALLSGATFLVVVGQVLARQVALSATTNPALRALGMTRGQIFASSVIRMAFISVAGAIIAVALAIAASPLTPIGPARLAEPSPGVSLNAGLLVLGFAGIVILLLAATSIPLWRSARGTAETTGWRSRLARSAIRSGLPPASSIGIGMALEPGRGRTAVPVRSALAGAVLAVAAGATAVIFGANLDRLVKTPDLYGWRWNAIFDTGFGLVPKADIARIGDDPDVELLSGGHYGNGNVTVQGEPVPAVGIDLLKGIAFPRLIEGRPPETADEVVLGTKVSKRVGARVGSSVGVAIGSSIERNMRVVGIGVFPALGHGSFEPTGLGEGVAFTAGVLAVGEAADAYTFAMVGFRPGTDIKVAAARLEQNFNRLELCGFELCEVVTEPRRPADISNYARVRGTPLALAGAFALLAAATLGHTLVTSVNRRRRDVAIMKTIGFVRRQVSSTIAWQALTVAVVALVFGLPLGMAAGRWAWLTFADQLGVPFDPRVPILPVLIAIPATILVANLIAALPARAAGRTRPALVLRSE